METPSPKTALHPTTRPSSSRGQNSTRTRTRTQNELNYYRHFNWLTEYLFSHMSQFVPKGSLNLFIPASRLAENLQNPTLDRCTHTHTHTSTAV